MHVLSIAQTYNSRVVVVYILNSSNVSISLFNFMSASVNKNTITAKTLKFSKQTSYITQDILLLIY